MPESVFLGIDVGTGSVRAAIFDARGTRLGLGTHPIQIWRPQEDFVEQSSDDIWRAAGIAVRAALAESGTAPDRVGGIGFDATCSLVLLDSRDQPVSASPTGRDEQNVIVWMDHRAAAQAERITRGRHEVLQYVGGAISPEMQTPKLLWLKEQLPNAFARAARFLDLPDFLTYRATGVDTRSLCTTVCKWTYVGHEARWDPEYFHAIGLAELTHDDFQRIGGRIRPMGERIGTLTAQSAVELGLVAGIPVAVSIIDAHAGGLGLLGVRLGDDEGANDPTDFNNRLALIGGTSSCHMAISREARFIDGIWGPYFSAMVPGWWLTEGGQSATGALIDHVIHTHARAAELAAEATAGATTVYALLNQTLDRLAAGVPFPAALTRELHVYPDFHGNRSPRADASLRGMVSGLRLSDSVESLALLYLATIQAIAHGTRHIIASMNARGYRIDTLVVCGGDVKNPVFVREHADATGCRIVLPREPEAVLLGSAMLGAVAAGAYPDLERAMAAMNAPSRVIDPAGGEIAGYHARKHQIFHRMHDDQLAYRRMMDGAART
jgi:FGGY-family pentulose kinase